VVALVEWLLFLVADRMVAVGVVAGRLAYLFRLCSQEFERENVEEHFNLPRVWLGRIRGNKNHTTIRTDVPDDLPAVVACMDDAVYFSRVNAHKKSIGNCACDLVSKPWDGISVCFVLSQSIELNWPLSFETHAAVR
jgi:hypothetical protein